VNEGGLAHWELWRHKQTNKEAGRKVNRQSLSIIEVKNKWNYTSSPTIYLHGLHRDNFMVFIPENGISTSTFKKKMLREIFGSETEEVTEELRCFCSKTK